MRLYSSSAKQFIRACETNQISEKLKGAFQIYRGHSPGESEINSWRNSLRAIADVFRLADFEAQGVILEYQLPLTSMRVDCIVTGRDAAGASHAVLIELKQWSSVEASAGPNEVITFVAKANRTVLHPSAQARGYVSYLQDSHSAFDSSEKKIHLSGCCYLHNYASKIPDPLLDQKFSELTAAYPLFNADQVEELVQHLKSKVGFGEGLDIAGLVEQNTYRASRKLMDHVADVIAGLPQYVLLDEQLVSFDAVFHAATRAFNERRKSLILVRGGPGSGKSVVALKLLGALMKAGFNANYATGSKAFTETLRTTVGRRGSTALKYTHNYIDAASHAVDVLIIDEAHRIREKTKIMYRKPGPLTQFEELFNAAKTLVLFIDDAQTVRPGEIGSAEYIRSAALAQGASISEFELEVQFRCGGADGFVNWIDNTLGIRDTANEVWVPSEDFTFQIVDSPTELERLVIGRASHGSSARVTAGFCWPWSKPNQDGTLVHDVVVDGFTRPWNAKPGSVRLANDVPEAALWATAPGGINQVGCVYTAQGFEFDYVGVIFGKDLRYDELTGQWIGDPSHSHDKEVKRSPNFLELVKNTYRILLSRGMKGCYVYFEDKATEKFFRSRMADSDQHSLPHGAELVG
jgi:DUF2075 family protein